MPQSLSLVNTGIVAFKVFLAELGQDSPSYHQLYSEKSQRLENKVGVCPMADELLGRARPG